MVPNVRIRPYEVADAGALHEAARESIVELFPWLTWCHPDYSMAEAEAWARSRPELFRAGVEYDFVVADEGGRFLGGCALNQIHRGHRFANLGYWVRSSAMGRGVAPAAVRQLAAFAFTTTDLVRLEILCAVGNARSRRVAEKSGAILEGTLRDRLFLHDRPHDAVLYSIVASDWRAAG